ncbi:MAG: hypothetical protein JSR82_06220 [Verrucomicrobia bacterium]|nr:hypothetical protein [Verrucomicrobiota bacterium]
MPAARRLATLAEVAQQTLAGADFWYALKDFLEAFRAAPERTALEPGPVALAQCCPKGAIYDAYLGAVAEHLACAQRWRPPPWAFAPHRSLERPVFFADSHALRVLLLMDSPAAFRSRNLFVSEDALMRV